MKGTPIFDTTFDISDPQAQAAIMRNTLATNSSGTNQSIINIIVFSSNFLQLKNYTQISTVLVMSY